MDIQRFGGASLPNATALGHTNNNCTVNNYYTQVNNLLGPTTGSTPSANHGTIRPGHNRNDSVPHQATTVINNFYQGSSQVNNYYPQYQQPGYYSGYSAPGYCGPYGAAGNYSGQTGNGMYGCYGSNYGNAASLVQNNYGNTYNFFGCLNGNNISGFNYQPQSYSQMQQPLSYPTSNGQSYGGQFVQNNYGNTYNFFVNNNGNTSNTEPEPQKPTSGTLKKLDDGSIDYTTTGGWKVNVNKTTIQLTDQDGNKTTKIWGDPHVVEADGSKWDWDAKTSTFQLPDGTKVTMNADSPNGVVKNTTIYDSAQMVNIDNSKMTFESKVDVDKAMKDDKATDDGKVYTTSNKGDDWKATTSAPKSNTTALYEKTHAKEIAYDKWAKQYLTKQGVSIPTDKSDSELHTWLQNKVKSTATSNTGAWPFFGYGNYQGTSSGSSSLIPSLGSTPTLSYDNLYLQAMQMGGMTSSSVLGSSINSPLLFAGMLSNYIQPGYQTTVPNYAGYSWAYYPPYQFG